MARRRAFPDLDELHRRVTTKRIRPLGPLLEVEYQVRHDEDGGVILAYRTDEVDTWGKRTYFRVLPDGDLQQWYLFPDEVLSEKGA